MEDHELITKAKSHLGGTVASDAVPPSPDDFPRIHVRNTAMVCFESNDGKERLFVLLDRATGEFVGGGASLRDQS